MNSVANVTPAQSIVLEALTDEPRRAAEIAREVGFIPSAVTGHLLALKAKGLACKHLNPTRWDRA